MMPARFKPRRTSVMIAAPNPATDAEQSQPGEILNSSGKPLGSHGNVGQTLSIIPFLTSTVEAERFTGAQDFIVPCVYQQDSSYKSLRGDTITAHDYGNAGVFSTVGWFWVPRGEQDRDGGVFIYLLLLTGDSNAGEKLNDENDVDRPAKKEVLHTVKPASSQATATRDDYRVGTQRQPECTRTFS
ncbi:hypothetical protein F52700_8349 [Fusarium sp. NRRL 52700]|nr:hypothetical protein F52700_8349 [Fusarium sp. NRRL 52700]